MTKKTFPRGFWNKQTCYEYALKFTNLGKFRQHHARAYALIMENKWGGVMLSHMISPKSPTGYWTKEICHEHALKFTSRNDFKDNSLAYAHAQSKGWLDDICSHMDMASHPKGYWTLKRCSDYAKKCKTRKEFKIRYRKAHNIAEKKGWISKICKHMKRLGNRLNRYIYYIEFADKSVYVGLTHDLERRRISHTGKSSNFKVRARIESGIQFSFKSTNKLYPNDKAAVMEAKVLKTYAKEGWEILNIKAAGALGCGNRIWDKKACAAEALVYDCRIDFVKGSPGAASAAYKAKWMDDITKHMVEVRKPKGHWNKEKCMKASSKCKTISEFRDKHPGAYMAATRLLVLDEVTSHLEREVNKKGFWTFEECQKVASISTSRGDMKNRNGSAYQSARTHGWLDIFFPPN